VQARTEPDRAGQIGGTERPGEGAVIRRLIDQAGIQQRGRRIRAGFGGVGGGPDQRPDLDSLRAQEGDLRRQAGPADERWNGTPRSPGGPRT
jgi:hypothetical protein